MEEKPVKGIENFEVYQRSVKLLENFPGDDLPILQKNLCRMDNSRKPIEKFGFYMWQYGRRLRIHSLLSAVLRSEAI